MIDLICKSRLFPCFGTPAVADEVVEEEEKEGKAGWSSGSSSAGLTPSTSSRSTQSAASLPGDEWRAVRKRLLVKIVRWAVLVVPLQQKGRGEKSRRDQPPPPLVKATVGGVWDDDIPNSDTGFSSSSIALSSASSSTVSASSSSTVPHANDSPEGKAAPPAPPGEGTSGDASVLTGLCLLVLLVLFVLVF